jgi:hypothetical protein
LHATVRTSKDRRCESVPGSTPGEDTGELDAGAGWQGEVHRGIPGSGERLHDQGRTGQSRSGLRAGQEARALGGIPDTRTTDRRGGRPPALPISAEATAAEALGLSASLWRSRSSVPEHLGLVIERPDPDVAEPHRAAVVLEERGAAAGLEDAGEDLVGREGHLSTYPTNMMRSQQEFKLLGGKVVAG